MIDVFIDGDRGTTGLLLRQRLEKHEGVHLLKIEEKFRKESHARKEMINAADMVFLCLPDDAAIEAVSMTENESTCIIDASTAHRTKAGWAYGFPELSKKHREDIKKAKRVAVPGCHAAGFCGIVYPLVKKGVLCPSDALCVFSLTGYTGGGKPMIESYEALDRPKELSSPRIYALPQQHKHLPEMQYVCGLDKMPLFSPVVADFPRGMIVTLPFDTASLQGQPSPAELKAFYEDYYRGQRLVSVAEAGEELAANAFEGKDSFEIVVCGNEDRLTVHARFDNLGKGASGAAVQCMNIMMGFDELQSLAV